jgi:hypothetical protein
MRRGIHVLAWLAMALAAPLLLADARPGLTVHETVLRSEPAGDAGEVATLPAETELSVFERLGGWYRVQANAGAGWLRLASLRFPSTELGAGDSGVDLILNSMRTGTYAGSSGTTTGVRGLDASDIDNASASEAQLEKLEALASSAEAGRKFASAGNLKPVEIAYLEPAGEVDESLLEQTRSARSQAELEAQEKAGDTCYGDRCENSDLPFLGGG